MRIDDNSRYLFKAPGAKRWLTRSRGRFPAAILPRGTNHRPTNFADPERFVLATDRNFLNLTEDLVRCLPEEFPLDNRDDGFAGPSAVGGNWNSLLGVTGQGSDPLALPLTNNNKFVESLGLVDELREQDIPYLDELIKLFFGHVAPANLHIRKPASTGFPFFTNEIDYKKQAALKCLKQADDFLDAMSGDSGQLKYALSEYHSIYLYAIQERMQPPTIITNPDGSYSAKPRVAPTEEESRAGIEGQNNVDFRVFEPNSDKIISNHFAMRRRPVWGGNGPLNYFLTAIMGCHRAVYLDRFKFTYKTRGPADKEARIQPFKYIRGADVKSMDTTVFRAFFDRVLHQLPKYWDERLVKVLERALFSSFVAPAPWRDTPEDYNPLFGPDPLSAEFTNHPGLPSGVAPNPDLGKLWMTFVYLILFKDAGAIRSVADIEPFLMGQNREHGLLDMSDDAVMMTNSLTIANKLEKGDSPYAVLEVEQPVVFLGDVFTMDGGVKRAYPNPVTYIVNDLVREKGIEKKDPVLYAEGIVARTKLYSATPIFRDLHRIYQEKMRKHLGYEVYPIANTVARMQSMDPIDAQVRENPDYLHYRIDPADVSPAVLDSLVSTIPSVDFFNDIKHLFKMATQDVGPSSSSNYSTKRNTKTGN